MQGNPRIISTSHKEFRFFLVASFRWFSACILTMKGQKFENTRLVGDNMQIQRVFTFQKSLLPFVCNRSANFWNWAKKFELCAKKMYKLCKRNSNRCMSETSNKVMTVIFVFWAKQWTLVTKRTTFSLNCWVTLVLWPWNTMLSLQPMLTNFPTRSSKLNSPKSITFQH